MPAFPWHIHSHLLPAENFCLMCIINTATLITIGNFRYIKIEYLQLRLDLFDDERTDTLFNYKFNSLLLCITVTLVLLV